MENGPRRLEIGNNKAYRNGNPYFYYKVKSTGENGQTAYICDQTTESGADGEKLIIIWDTDKNACVAWEGRYNATRFELRQACFKTASNFFEAGWHDWLVNNDRDPAAPAGEDVTGSDRAMSCQTKVVQMWTVTVM